MKEEIHELQLSCKTWHKALKLCSLYQWCTIPNHLWFWFRFRFQVNPQVWFQLRYSALSSIEPLIQIPIPIPPKSGIIPELIPIPESESCITGLYYKQHYTNLRWHLNLVPYAVYWMWYTCHCLFQWNTSLVKMSFTDPHGDLKSSKKWPGSCLILQVM